MLQKERSVRDRVFGFLGVVLLNLKFVIQSIRELQGAIFNFKKTKDLESFEKIVEENYQWLSFIYEIVSDKIKSFEGPYRKILFRRSRVLKRLDSGYSKDKFEALFQRQEELNCIYNRPLTRWHTRLAERDPEAMVYCGRALDDLLKAMSSEIEELRNCTAWKHWCTEAKEGRRYEILDLRNARLEVIDMLHFWITLAQAVGLTADQAFDLYWSKSEVNIKRQEIGYSSTDKDKFNDEVDIPD